MGRQGHAQLLLGDEKGARELGFHHGESGAEYQGGDVPRNVRRQYSIGWGRGRTRRNLAAYLES